MPMVWLTFTYAKYFVTDRYDIMSITKNNTTCKPASIKIIRQNNIYSNDLKSSSWDGGMAIPDARVGAKDVSMLTDFCFFHSVTKMQKLKKSKNYSFGKLAFGQFHAKATSVRRATFKVLKKSTNYLAIKSRKLTNILLLIYSARASLFSAKISLHPPSSCLQICLNHYVNTDNNEMLFCFNPELLVSNEMVLQKICKQ